MKTFKEIILGEKDYEDKVFVDGHNTLWFGYLPNSGTTYPNFDKIGYVTDKKGDEKQNTGLINDVFKFAKTATPIKSTKEKRLFAIPMYIGKSQKEYDIYDGTEKPKKLLYMMVYDNNVIKVVNFFDNKNEALNWLKH